MLYLACGSIILFAFLTGSWAFTSYYLRYVALGSFAVAVFVKYRRVRQHVAIAEDWSWRVIFPALVLVLFTALNALSISSYYQPEKSLDISFPFTSSSYCVLQGGNSIVTNPFHVLGGNGLAYDLVKLNAFGNRAGGIAPSTLNAYKIFGETLHSPCAGTVLTARDDLPDNAPGQPDPNNPEGNYIILKCGESEVFFAHLKRGSIAVTVGEVVAVGEPMGKIGNSGNTLEPHLHIGATRGGAEIGLRFDERILSVNSVVTR